MKALFLRLRTSAMVVILCLWSLVLLTVSSHAATTIRWLTLSDGAWPASVKKVIAAFEAQNPDIKVELDTYPFRDLFETIEVRMKAQDADVDLISVDVPLVASYSVRGYLAPIDEYFSKDEIEKTWVKPSWQAGTYKGSFMAAPQNSSSQFFYINRKLFQQYNVTPPKALEPGKETSYDEIASIAKNDRWTWDQVVDAAKKLTKDTKGDGKIDVWGFEFDQVSRLYQLQCLGESLGGPLVSPRPPGCSA